MKLIQKYIPIHNQRLQDMGIPYEPYIEWIEHTQQDWPGNAMKVCITIKTDIVSYFKEHIYKPMRTLMNDLAENDLSGALTFDPSKTICVHLRLDDVIDRMDYDGRISTSYYAEKLNRGETRIDLDEESSHGAKHGVFVPGWNRFYNPYDCQAPIDQGRLLPIIQSVQEKYPDHEVIVVASPMANTEITLPYKTLRSDNPDMDLYALCNCDVLICSRSLFCFTAVYLTQAREIWVPMWGHIAGTGLTSKFDNSKFNYFY